MKKLEALSRTISLRAGQWYCWSIHLYVHAPSKKKKKKRCGPYFTGSQCSEIMATNLIMLLSNCCTMRSKDRSGTCLAASINKVTIVV